MNNPDLDQWIVNRLGKSADKNNLILEICETQHLSWPDAEALVTRVESEQENAIAGRQFPVLFILAFLIFLGGLATVVYEIFVLIPVMNEIVSTLPAGMDVFTFGRFVFEVALGPISGTLFGIAMMLGSIVGMRKAWIPLLDHLAENKKIRD